MKALAPVLMILCAILSATHHPMAARWFAGLWMVMAALAFLSIWGVVGTFKKRGDKRAILSTLYMLEGAVPWPSFAAWVLALIAHVNASDWRLAGAWLGLVVLGYMARRVCAARATDHLHAIYADEAKLDPHLHDA